MKRLGEVPGNGVVRIAPFRIFEGVDQQDALVALHGWLTEPVVEELAEVVARTGRRTRIDLTHLVGADQAGLLVLRRLRDEAGVMLSGSSPFFTMALETMRAGLVHSSSRSTRNP